MGKMSKEPHFITTFSFPESFRPTLEKLRKKAALNRMSTSEYIAQLLTKIVREEEEKSKQILEIEAIDKISEAKQLMEEVKKYLEGKVLRERLKEYSMKINTYIIALKEYSEEIDLPEVRETLNSLEQLLGEIVDRYRNITPEEEEIAREEDFKKFMKEHWNEL